MVYYLVLSVFSGLLKYNNVNIKDIIVLENYDNISRFFYTVL